MIRQLLVVLFAAALVAVGGAPLAAQELSKDQFLKEFHQGYELGEDKIMDRAVKRGSRFAIEYYEDLCWEVRNGTQGADVKCEAIVAAWGRTFPGKDTLEKAQRWVDGATAPLYQQLQGIRTNAAKLWSEYEQVSKELNKPDYRIIFDGYQTLAKSAAALGHYLEAAELWGLASVAGSKMPGKTFEEREEVVFVLEQMLRARDQWSYDFDDHYVRNKAFVEAELVRIEEAKKNADQRKADGYDPNAKGVEGLVMPNVPAAKYALKFEPLKDWQKELDYGPKNGPVPAFWWLVSLGQEDTSRKLDWFRRRDMYMHRTGATKFAIGFDPSDAKSAVEVDAGSRAKATTFWLDEGKAVPYAMFFWMGTDTEPTGMAQCNYSPSKEVANLYYRSAASWTAQIDKDTLTLYDDDANGKPGDAAPFEAGFKLHSIGEPTGDGVAAPLLDSMQIGKEPRVPFSQFVQLPTGWHYMESVAGTEVTLRPLNPEYFKTGKIKLAWAGAKSSSPDQLVVQGRGDYQAAIFDLAGGKEVEVPAGEYTVIQGRIVQGKGGRVQTATIYPGAEAKPFRVEEGKTFTLEMGAPFVLDFVRSGDKNTSIDALGIHVTERSGCKITELHGTSLGCSVLAAKDDTGKGKKEVGEFVPFTDANLVATASRHYSNLGFLVACFPMPKGYQKGEMVLSFELPEDGMKVGLFVKKHPLFGKLETVWR